MRVVPAHQRLHVYRFGQSLGEKGPGIVLVIPFIDQVEVVDAPPPGSG